MRKDHTHNLINRFSSQILILEISIYLVNWLYATDTMHIIANTGNDAVGGQQTHHDVYILQ